MSTGMELPLARKVYKYRSVQFISCGRIACLTIEEIYPSDMSNNRFIYRSMTFSEKRSSLCRLKSISNNNAEKYVSLLTEDPGLWMVHSDLLC